MVYSILRDPYEFQKLPIGLKAFKKAKQAVQEAKIRQVQAICMLCGSWKDGEVVIPSLLREEYLLDQNENRR